MTIGQPNFHGIYIPPTQCPSERLENDIEEIESTVYLNYIFKTFITIVVFIRQNTEQKATLFFKNKG